MAVAVDAAAAVDAAEQHLERALPGELGELVDCGDHERRQEPIDLFVHGDDRHSLPWRLPLGEFAIPVRTVQKCSLSAVGLGTLEVFAFLKAFSTPRTGN